MATTDYFERIQASELKNPTLIGFNIKDKPSFDFASKYARGAIIGTAFINLLTSSNSLEKDIPAFIKGVKG
jgi:tryptophan synthase alpha chain